MRSRANSSELIIPEEPNLLMRLFIWLIHELGVEAACPSPIRVFYKFGSGGWRSRSTSQLHKVNRCR
jgi:hypothetical protein